MTRFFTLAVAAALAAGMSTSAWSQGGQSGAGSGSAGASGSAGTSGSAADANAAGAAGTTAAGQAGTTAAGQGGTTAAGQGGTTTAGQAGSQIGTGRQNPSNVPGQRQFGVTPTPGANFNFPNQTPFFNDPGARRQLNMNDNQFNTLSRAHQEAVMNFNRAAMNLRNDPNLTEAQRTQQLQQLQAQFNQRFGQTLDTTFTDPRLRQRFDQLDRQFQGFGAFNDPVVRQQLDLTPQQQRQLRRLANAWRQQLQRLRRAGNDNAQLTAEQWAQLQAQNMQQINSVLTPQQQQSWSQLTGQPFNFPPTAFQIGGPANQVNQPFQGVQKPGPDVSPGPEATRPPAQAQRPSVQPQPRNNQGQSQSTQGGTVR